MKIELKTLEFTSDVEQLETSKASGGRIKDVPEIAWNKHNNWIAENKLDGTRLLMHITNDCVRFTTRCISKKTNKYMERTNNLPHLRDMNLGFLKGTILDGEGCSPTNDFSDTVGILGSNPERAWDKQKEIGWAEYCVFDILKYKGDDVRHLRYLERHKLLQLAMKTIKMEYPEVNIQIIEWVLKNKREYYNTIVKNGGEGIMLKNLNSTYYDKKGLVKVKKHQRFTMIIDSYKEGTGKYKGMIGSIGVKFYNDDKMTYVGGINDKLRHEMTKNFKDYIGRIVEVECEEMIKTGGLRHPRFIDFRFDKTKEECIRTQNSIIK